MNQKNINRSLNLNKSPNIDHRNYNSPSNTRYSQNEFFFSEQHVYIEAGNDEHKHKDKNINKKEQQNRINYKDKTGITMKGN